MTNTTGTAGQMTESDWLAREAEIDIVDTELARLVARIETAAVEIAKLELDPGAHPGASLLRVLADAFPMESARIALDCPGLHLRTDVDDPQVEQAVWWFRNNEERIVGKVGQVRELLAAGHGTRPESGVDR